MTFNEILNFRRSIRFYKPISIDPEKVRQCVELSTLAPNSSNMQLWEFYHVTDPAVIKQLAVACLNQTAATTVVSKLNMSILISIQQLLKQEFRQKFMILF